MADANVWAPTRRVSLRSTSAACDPEEVLREVEFEDFASVENLLMKSVLMTDAMLI